MEAGAQALGFVAPAQPELPAAPQIPSQCLTCVRFRALREHVVGRTSALPVSVYDYYEPGRPAPPSCTPAGLLTLSPHHMLTRPPPPTAFEATRFYNVSARSPLAQELCTGPACNEVERSAAQGPGEWTGPPQPHPRAWGLRVLAIRLRLRFERRKGQRRRQRGEAAARGLWSGQGHEFFAEGQNEQVGPGGAGQGRREVQRTFAAPSPTIVRRDSGALPLSAGSGRCEGLSERPGRSPLWPFIFQTS